MNRMITLSIQHQLLSPPSLPTNIILLNSFHSNNLHPSDHPFAWKK